MIPIMYLSPESYNALYGKTRILNNSQKYLCTFQLFIAVTKFRVKQRNLFLECMHWQ